MGADRLCPQRPDVGPALDHLERNNPRALSGCAPLLRIRSDGFEATIGWGEGEPEGYRAGQPGGGLDQHPLSLDLQHIHPCAGSDLAGRRQDTALRGLALLAQGRWL